MTVNRQVLPPEIDAAARCSARANWSPSPPTPCTASARWRGMVAAVARLYTAKLRAPTKPSRSCWPIPPIWPWWPVTLPPPRWRWPGTSGPARSRWSSHRAAAVPDEVTAGGDTVAVRVPDHPLAHALIRAGGRAAGRHQRQPLRQASPVTAEEVAAQLAGRVALILDGGRCPGGVPSTWWMSPGERRRHPAAGADRPGQILAAVCYHSCHAYRH